MHFQRVLTRTVSSLDPNYKFSWVINALGQGAKVLGKQQ